MTRTDDDFGFIDYFVRGNRMRLCAQFMDSALGPMAVLGAFPKLGQPLDSLMVMVDPAMNPVHLGDFNAVLGSYGEQLATLVAQDSFAQSFADGEMSMLQIFKTLHVMKLHGYGVPQAKVRVRQVHVDLVESFVNAMADMGAFLKRYPSLEHGTDELVASPDPATSAFQVAAA